MTVQSEIEACLKAGFDTEHCEVINESHMHNVPEGSESHFKVTLVSPEFTGKMLVARHKMVYTILGDKMQQIHALALHTYAVDEWQKQQQTPTSPPCMGGSQG